MTVHAPIRIHQAAETSDPILLLLPHPSGNVTLMMDFVAPLQAEAFERLHQLRAGEYQAQRMVIPINGSTRGQAKEPCCELGHILRIGGVQRVIERDRYLVARNTAITQDDANPFR